MSLLPCIAIGVPEPTDALSRGDCALRLRFARRFCVRRRIPAVLARARRRSDARPCSALPTLTRWDGRAEPKCPVAKRSADYATGNLLAQVVLHVRRKSIMNKITKTEYVTRDSILKLLSDDEVASVSTAETADRLADGDEFVDMRHLDKGVQHAGKWTPIGRVVPRKSVHASTWTKIVAKLTVPSS
jgi:hypothetical protein